MSSFRNALRTLRQALADPAFSTHQTSSLYVRDYPVARPAPRR
jgi:hypothetical protein